MWGRLLWRCYIRDYNITVTQQGQSLVSLWPLYRVCKPTNLICARHWDTETVRYEEEGIQMYTTFT